MEEIWKDVVGYEDTHEISSIGRVRRKPGCICIYKDGRKKVLKPRILKDKNKNAREVRVDLVNNEGKKTVLVHRLVAQAFLKEDIENTIVNHKDGNPRNNKVENLEWCDYKYNSNHAFDNDLMNTNKKTKLTDLETKKEYFFRSRSQASFFLGKTPGYLGVCKRKGISHRDESGNLYIEERL